MKFRSIIGYRPGIVVLALTLAGALWLSACATDPNAPPKTPCEQASDIVSYSGIAISVAQTGFALVEAAGTVKPGSPAEAIINTAFASAQVALASAQAHIAAGDCTNVAPYAADVTKALGVAAVEIAKAKAAEQAAKDAAKADKKKQKDDDAKKTP